MLRRAIWLFLTSVAIASPWTGVCAGESGKAKPVAVASFAGYNAARTDVDFLGKISSNSELVAGLEFLIQMATGGAGLEGLDKDRPWGVVVKADQAEADAGQLDPKRLMGGYAFLPVTDLDKLLGAFRGAIDAPKEEDGLVVVRQNGGPPNYIKEAGGWAFVANDPKWLADLPENPLTLLGELAQEYDLAVSFDLAALPENIRERAIAKAKADASRELVQKPGEADEEFAARKVVTQQALRIASIAVRELEHVTLGWVLDAESGKTHLDVSVTARGDTGAAGWFARLERTKSNFSGFLMPDAAISGNWSVEFGKANIEGLSAVIDALRSKAIGDIESQNKSFEEQELAKKLVNNLLDVAQSTLATGRFDGGMIARLDADAVTLASGKYVAEGEKIDATIKEVVATVGKYEPAIIEQLVKLDAAEHNGVRFHTLTLPVTDETENREQIQRMFGPAIDVVVGVGPESVYTAIGRDALGTLLELIDGSKENAARTVAPLEFSLDVRQLAAFLAEYGGGEAERQQARKLAGVLDEIEGEKDRITVTAGPIPQGVKLRLDIDEGILIALGVLARQQQTGQ